MSTLNESMFVAMALKQLHADLQFCVYDTELGNRCVKSIFVTFLVC